MYIYIYIYIFIYLHLQQKRNKYIFFLNNIIPDIYTRSPLGFTQFILCSGASK